MSIFFATLVRWQSPRCPLPRTLDSHSLLCYHTQSEMNDRAPLGKGCRAGIVMTIICSRAPSWQDKAPQDDSFGAVEVFACFQTHFKRDRPAACVPIPPHECKFSHPTPHPTQEGCIVDCDKPFLAGYRAIADIHIARVRQAAACGG